MQCPRFFNWAIFSIIFYVILQVPSLWAEECYNFVSEKKSSEIHAEDKLLYCVNGECKECDLRPLLGKDAELMLANGNQEKWVPTNKVLYIDKKKQKWVVTKAAYPEDYIIRHVIAGTLMHLVFGDGHSTEFFLVKDEKNHVTTATLFLERFINLKSFLRGINNTHVCEEVFSLLQKKRTIQDFEKILAAALIFSDMDVNWTNVGAVTEDGSLMAVKIDYDNALTFYDDDPTRFDVLWEGAGLQYFIDNYNFYKLDLIALADAFKEINAIPDSDWGLSIDSAIQDLQKHGRWKDTERLYKIKRALMVRKANIPQYVNRLILEHAIREGNIDYLNQYLSNPKNSRMVDPVFVKHSLLTGKNLNLIHLIELAVIYNQPKSVKEILKYSTPQEKELARGWITPPCMHRYLMQIKCTRLVNPMMSLETYESILKEVESK